MITHAKINDEFLNVKLTNGAFQRIEVESTPSYVAFSVSAPSLFGQRLDIHITSRGKLLFWIDNALAFKGGVETKQPEPGQWVPPVNERDEVEARKAQALRIKDKPSLLPEDERRNICPVFDCEYFNRGLGDDAVCVTCGEARS